MGIRNISWLIQIYQLLNENTIGFVAALVSGIWPAGQHGISFEIGLLLCIRMCNRTANAFRFYSTHENVGWAICEFAYLSLSLLKLNPSENHIMIDVIEECAATATYFCNIGSSNYSPEWVWGAPVCGPLIAPSAHFQVLYQWNDLIYHYYNVAHRMNINVQASTRRSSIASNLFGYLPISNYQISYTVCVNVVGLEGVRTQCECVWFVRPGCRLGARHWNRYIKICGSSPPPQASRDAFCEHFRINH